jgi:uncharacterized membrane protein YphA (DoxX/SURF4 family)
VKQKVGTSTSARRYPVSREWTPEQEQLRNAMYAVANSGSHATPAEVTPSQAVQWRQRCMTVLRVGAGLFCGFDAWMKWHLSGNQQQLISYLHNATHSTTAPLAMWSTIWLTIAQHYPQILAGPLALFEICLALCLISGAFTRVAALGGFVFTCLCYPLAIGYPTISSQSTPDLGITLVALFMFAGLFMSNAGRPYGLDALRKRSVTGNAQNHYHVSYTPHSRKMSDEQKYEEPIQAQVSTTAWQDEPASHRQRALFL